MNILAIGAHPDDIEYGCGGSLVKFREKGYKIHLLIMTKGEMGGIPRVRVKEQAVSAKLIGADICWGGYKDTETRIDKGLINKIENVIKKVKPHLIFAPYFNDTHQDHRNVSQATLAATRYSKNILFYEITTTVDFTSTSVFVDISDVLDSKLELLKAHRSQASSAMVAGLSILDSARSCAAFRGFQNRVKYAEGFIPFRLSITP